MIDNNSDNNGKTKSRIRKRRRASKELTTDDIKAGPPLPLNQLRHGSIAQQLDMNEQGPLRGDEILHSHGIAPDDHAHPELDERFMLGNYHIDMAEDTREGDEESGDEHSSGLQGSDQQELQYDTESVQDADSGAPGETTEKNAHLDPTKKGYRRRAA